jgi:hypothetical protein
MRSTQCSQRTTRQAAMQADHPVRAAASHWMPCQIECRNAALFLLTQAWQPVASTIQLSPCIHELLTQLLCKGIRCLLGKEQLPSNPFRMQHCTTNFGEDGVLQDKYDTATRPVWSAKTGINNTTSKAVWRTLRPGDQAPTRHTNIQQVNPAAVHHTLL